MFSFNENAESLSELSLAAVASGYIGIFDLSGGLSDYVSCLSFSRISVVTL